jgi:uncharacterized damage-inducible protein DinB
VITDIDAFLRYFDGINRRAVRDVGLLPAAAEQWKPPAGAGEGAWTIAEIVGHMALSRGFFARAYRGGGWVAEPGPPAPSTREEWREALNRSAEQLRDSLAGTPAEWLTRKVQPLAAEDRPLSGWRLLLMMTEHDIHHRSQIDTYAGVMGWPVAHIYGRSAEEVGLAARTPTPGH